MTYASVIVGTDGSATAELAVKEAARLAAGDGATLVVVTAFKAAHRTAMEELSGTARQAEAERQSGAPADLRWALTDRGQADGVAQQGRQIARDAGAAAVIILSDEGDPARVLVDAAQMHDADLIVVGSVGLVGAQRFLLGSVASAVLHHAPCDVLVVDTNHPQDN